MNIPEPDFRHIVAMSDAHGLFEHAQFAVPRREHGYCTDDMARLLVVACREDEPDDDVQELARLAMRFLVAAQGPDGECHNRMDMNGQWTDDRSDEDCWGRSLWAFGTAAARSRDHALREEAAACFAVGAQVRSKWSHAMAFAALGAAEILSANPHDRVAPTLLKDAVEVIGTSRDDLTWPWPEPRLEYANAVLAEAVLVAGIRLGDETFVADGLLLLRWLLGHETRGRMFSVCPVGGCDPGASSPAFDQQPIEVAALVDACALAATVSDDPRWSEAVHRGVMWFLGENDGNVSMMDSATGGGYDGLTPTGPNRNEGAESTLSLLMTLQHARPLVPAPAS